jgi:hypothetical protein
LCVGPDVSVWGGSGPVRILETSAGAMQASRLWQSAQTSMASEQICRAIG